MTSADPRAIALSALGRAIGAATDPRALHGAIAEAAVVALQARLARVWLDDPQARVLRAVGSFGVEPAVESVLLDTVVLPYGAGVPGRIFESGTPEFTRDAHDDVRWVNARFIRELDLHAYAGLPLVVHDRCVGVLSVLFDAPRTFTDDEQVLACALADVAAIVVQIGQLHEERLRSETLRAVTGLGNAAAHELNSPLTTLVGHLQFLARDTAGQHAPAQRLARIGVAVDQITEVVRRMGRITRVAMLEHTSPDLPVTLDLKKSTE